MDKLIHKVSVRNLVEFILRSGDIDFGIYASSVKEAALEGSRIHRKLQKEAGDGYKAEVRLSIDLEYDDFILQISGIADGIISTEAEVVIDEIKTVSIPLEFIDENYNPLHWAQAKCYAYIYSIQNNINVVTVRLTYCNAETKNTKFIKKEFAQIELTDFFYNIVDKYYVWADFSAKHQRDRNNSILGLSFPYKSYRKGQKKLAASVYYTIRDKNKLFASAPTGIGKTISVLFPSLKAMAINMGEKIFYLTAKTITRQAAEDALKLMENKGLVIKQITITAKEKICPNGKTSCNPVDCRRARGHYDRVNDAVLDILKSRSIINRELIEQYSEKHMVCPFEYSLDISNWVDCIICDYNYAFDPRVYLRRYFEIGGDNILLVDEAHNLVDRAREMFSASLRKSSFLSLRREVKAHAPDLYKSLGAINKYFIELRKTFDNKYDTRSTELSPDIYNLVQDFIEQCEVCLFHNKESNITDGLIELYFECLSFTAVFRLYDEHYISYVTRENNDVILKLFCVDPSHLLKKASGKNRATIFFSATLMPMQYYMDMLGCKEEDKQIILPSPFDRRNMCLMVAGNISTRYKDREMSMEAIVQYIKSAVSLKKGNYMVYFPSFEYMNNIVQLYIETFPHDRIIYQSRIMDETAREDFLLSFKEQPDENLIGFAVMGGIFSEGIDLTGDRLSGVIIVGVCLPQICGERDLIRDYFDEKNGMGYEYSYKFPGMNRVLQAAGRVIRTENDRGFILLIDDRFLQKSYLSLFPDEWKNYIKVHDTKDVANALSAFWYSK